MVILKGKLVSLEPLNIEKHAEDYYQVSQDANIHKYVGNTVPETIDEMIDLLKLYEEHFINWMIISNSTQKVIGIMRLSKPTKENELLVAGESQRLHSDYWRKGYMKEAKQLFYEYVFKKLEIDILYADVWEGNINSMKSLEASGYKQIDKTYEVFSKTGKTIVKYFYEFTKDDYLKRSI